MIMKRLLGGTVMLLAVAMPATAQVSPDTGAPAGDAMAKPADPRFPATGPSTGPQRQQDGEDRAATNADTASPAPPTRSDDTAEAGGDPATRPAETNIEPAQTVLGTRGGGALARDQIYADDLAEYKVVDGGGNEIGDVADVVLNLETGKVDTLIVSGGGLAGIGDKLYDVPWDQVASVDRRAEQIGRAHV